MRRTRRRSLCEFIPTKHLCGRSVSVAYASCVIKLVNRDDFALHVLAFTNSIPVTKYLLTLYDPNGRQGLALNLAVDCSFSEKVQVLIAAGANPNLVHSSYIRSVIHNGRINILRLLVDGNVTLDMSALKMMCRDHEVLKEYLGMCRISSEIRARLLDYTRQFNMPNSRKLLRACDFV